MMMQADVKKKKALGVGKPIIYLISVRSEHVFVIVCSSNLTGNKDFSVLNANFLTGQLNRHLTGIVNEKSPP